MFKKVQANLQQNSNIKKVNIPNKDLCINNQEKLLQQVRVYDRPITTISSRPSIFIYKAQVIL